jgi:hypothetical protein
MILPVVLDRPNLVTPMNVRQLCLMIGGTALVAVACGGSPSSASGSTAYAKVLDYAQ